MATQFNKISDAFQVLGQAENVGKAFMILEEAWARYVKEVEDLPWPDYAHRVVRDRCTGHYIVERPDGEGKYPPRKWEGACGFELVRQTSQRAQTLLMAGVH